MRWKSALRLGLGVGTALLAVLGCSGDHARLICPGEDCPTLIAFWPWSEGRSWTFGYGERVWVTAGAPAYPTPEAVPPAAPVDSVAVMLDRALTAHPPDQAAGTYRMRFEGTLTTQSGAVGKNLRTEMVEDSSANLRPGGPSMDPFWRRLAEVRPDLRARIGSRDPDEGSGLARPPGHPLTAPLFLHGYAWDRLPDRIGTYGDISRDLAWVFLTSDLAAGATFTHQLVPEFADDVYLHGKIRHLGQVSTPAGDFTDCVECDYLIDYGISAWTSESGQVVGYGRGVDVGSIVYAPGVGPVRSREFRAAVGPGYGEDTTIQLDLAATGFRAAAAP